MINTETFKKSYNGEFNSGGASGVDIELVAQQIAEALDNINMDDNNVTSEGELEFLTGKILTMDKMMTTIKEDVHMLIHEKLRD